MAALTLATRAVMPVLYGGRAVDLAGARDALAERGIPVVEDAAQAFGSHHGVRRVGATGVLICFSFGPIKSLTCGQGGAVIPRSPQEADRVRALRMLGIRKSQADRIRSTSYTVDCPGMRYPMSTLNVAIGRVQLAHFPQTEVKRRQLWRAYRDAMAGLDGVALVDVDVDSSVPFNCVVRVPAAVRGQVHARLQARGIGVGVHYPPNHLQPVFAAWRRSLPVTERVGRQILSLPVLGKGALAAHACGVIAGLPGTVG